MSLAARPSLAAVLLLTFASWGCNEATTTTATSVNETPSNVLEPTAPDESKGTPAKPSTAPAASASAKPATGQTEPAKAGTETPEPATEPAPPAAAKEAAPAAETPKETPPAPAGKEDATAASPGDRAEVSLVPVNFDELLARIAAKKARLTMVDAWATWCGPCKENFPHVVEMHHKYGGQGLQVISLSLDEPGDSKAKSEALKFLQAKKATFTNFLLDEKVDVGFDKLNVSTIPAVFLFGPDGKEVKRFTGDDPNKQFTYDQVEKTVAAMLQGKEPPK